MSLSDRPLYFPNGKVRTYGIIEIFIATMIFFSPNFLLLIDFLREKLFMFLLYDFIIIFLLVSIVAHRRFTL